MTRKVLGFVGGAILSLGLVVSAVQADDSRWSIDAEGVITDSRTGLQWHVGPNNVDWDEAESYCQNLNVAGGGWRMPTLEELRGLYTGGENWDSHQSLPPVFKGKELDLGWVWSSEAVDSSSMWLFYFYQGEEHWHYRDVSNEFGRVFAVRSSG